MNFLDKKQNVALGTNYKILKQQIVSGILWTTFLWNTYCVSRFFYRVLPTDFIYTYILTFSNSL